MRFVLVPGAGGAPSYWDLVVPLLRDRGHDAVAVDLPGPDPAAGLPEYTDRVLSAVGDGRGSWSWACRWARSRRSWPAPARPSTSWCCSTP
ncbi:alpha/beta fold hydrolase [Actinokineospora soli]|uniref:Alpha/beta fold hydrolase n=1 Tax=Actinokineospora soli TaxID=1048753 RepID=A0ABW2TXR9_9PSEU